MVNSLRNFLDARSEESFSVVLESIENGYYHGLPRKLAEGIGIDSPTREKTRWLHGILDREGLAGAYRIEDRDDDIYLVARGVYAVLSEDFPNCVSRFKYEVHFDGEEICNDNLFRDGRIVKPESIEAVYEKIPGTRDGYKRWPPSRVARLKKEG